MSSSDTDASSEDSREDRCRREVLELHKFLQDWSNGAIEPTDKSFARFADVIDEDFVIISPDGQMTARGPLVEGLRGVHGRWRKEGGDPGRIRIENFRVHRKAEDMMVATYEEWHEVDGKTRGRLSTVVFGERQGTPAGVVWLHLHEGWMP